MSPDVHALTGAYVLDAVSDLERADFERHIAQCDACAQEVRELRGTAARLGQAASAEPPVWLKSQVMAKIAEVRQVPRDPALLAAERPARGGWTLRLSVAAAAVLLVIAGALGVLLVQQQGDLDDSRDYAASVASVLSAEDAKLATGKGTQGGSATIVTSRSAGKGLVFTKDMPALSDGKVYQAWLIGPDDSMNSAGLMPTDPSSRMNLAIGSAKGFGVTVEPAGGSERPSLPPVMQVDFPA
jgi:anti-sigma-K factor RskA